MIQYCDTYQTSSIITICYYNSTFVSVFIVRLNTDTRTAAGLVLHTFTVSHTRA